ncbi:MAG: hypothetical protein HC915_20735 [Anaerolineae bacterium]|nr:hypothetical protein [Anaerolineae bacterium]
METLDYLVAGYLVGWGILVIMVGSLWARFRRAQQEERLLEALETETRASDRTSPPLEATAPEVPQQVHAELAETR